MRHPPVSQLELDVGFIRDPDRLRDRQVEWQRRDGSLRERSRAEIDGVHREHSGDMPALGGPHGQRGGVDAERKTSARPRGTCHHRRDIGQNALRNSRLETGIGQKLHGLNRPFTPHRVSRGREPCLHVDRVAHPWIVRPRSDHSHDRPDHVQLHSDRPRLSVAGTGRRPRAGEGRKEQPLKVGIAVGIELHVGFEPFHPHAAEIAERKEDAGEPVA